MAIFQPCTPNIVHNHRIVRLASLGKPTVASAPRRSTGSSAGVTPNSSCSLRCQLLGRSSTPHRRTVHCKSGVAKGLLSKCIPNFVINEPHVAYLADGLDDVLLPILLGWLLIQLISALAEWARKWCDDNPDEPLSLEVISLLPAALEGPSRWCVTFLVTTRVLRQLAGMLQGFVDTFTPRWDPFVDVLVGWIISALGPLDQTLIKLYTIVTVAVATRVLIKWKTIALEFILKHQRAKDRQQYAEQHDYYHAGSSSDSSVRSDSSSSAASKSQQSFESAGDAGAVSEAGVVTLEGPGRILSVEMRPKVAPTSPDDDAFADADAGAGGGAGGSAAGAWAADGAAGARAAAAGSRSWFAGGKSADDIERVVLPLDGILSWVLVLVAGLFTVQTLGLNIQPLLAVGGAGSIIIGLATQTLLTNAVMGVNIFLSRPFVAGDSVTIQGIGNIIISGTVEKVTPLRTILRTDDDTLVMVNNKSVAEMVVYNRSRREQRSRLSAAARRKSRQRMKFKVKLPHKELQQLEALQEALGQTLRRPGVAQQSININLSRFTDAGAELLVKCLLLVGPGTPLGQRLLLDLSLTVRQHGATLVSIM